MTNEDLLLRYCARIHADGDIESKIQSLLRDHLNWDYVFSEAFIQGVSSLIYRSLSKTNGLKLLIPKSIWETLENNYYNIASRNILLNKKIDNVLDSFQKAGFEVIILKGIRLIKDIYANVGLRTMKDMDILIREKDLLGADSILRGLGYSTWAETEDLKSLIFYSHSYLNSVMYNGKDSSIGDNLHLHWHLINSSLPVDFYMDRIEMEKIWREARLINLGEKRLKVLAFHHELIYLCMHSFSHFYDRLILLYDINEYIKRNNKQIDWEKVISDAFEFNLQKPVYYGLYLAFQILNADIPKFVFSRLKTQGLGTWDCYFLNSIIKNKHSLHLRAIAYLLMNRKLKEKVRFIYRSLFPPRTILALIKMKKASKIGFLDYISYVRDKLAKTNLRLLTESEGRI